MAEITTQEQEKPRIEVRGVSMYPKDWAAMEEMAKDQGVSVSASLRRIVRDRKRLQRMEEAMVQYLRLENGYRLGLITQDEFLGALGLVTDMARGGRRVPAGDDGDEQEER